ncbi:MAG: 16S rRNA (cytosine(1402)-N(4))-methyltransferase RsmH [Candidatus Onthomorpha sp.]|nr:16S rRNA (cytosine(1402)-N(4))-methyltransferase RsmH [Bacteroidales bacterium]MDY4585090.1 16S rRNA (cytosine(1402)-N(4))-methyltransferase RsmH [Candidatus Onthomorpha sp.]
MVFEEEYHVPVMLQECIEALDIKPCGTYVDVTFGGGGHSRAILEKLSSEGRLFAFDQDPDAVANAIDDERFCLIEENFDKLSESLRLYRATKIDGIIADLGISSHQIDCPERGFSTRFDGALDLRMDYRHGLTASDVVNSYSQQELCRVFSEYGELGNAYNISKLIASRQSEGIFSTSDLQNLLQRLAPKGKENKFFAKVFQALRIEVNQELEALKKMLSQSAGLLAEGGRLVVMSYHSLEDRIVKNFMKTGNCEGEVKKDFFGNVVSDFEVLTRKPVVASEEEMQLNPRSRSAKLRVAKKRHGI